MAISKFNIIQSQCPLIRTAKNNGNKAKHHYTNHYINILLFRKFWKFRKRQRYPHYRLYRLTEDVDARVHVFAGTALERGR